MEFLATILVAFVVSTMFDTADSCTSSSKPPPPPIAGKRSLLYHYIQIINTM